jgi:micrococcal nuclease
MVRRLLPILLFCVLGVALVLRSGDDPAPDADAARVVRIVDGDTIRVQFGDGREEPVRYIGIDTAERGDEPCFSKATEANARLVEGERVRLERDVSERDRYDRLLAYVYRESDGLFVNEELVKLGLAEAREYPPDTAQAGRLEAAERGARRGC